MNNPLAVISGRAQLLAAKITDAGMKQEASLIAQQGERLSQIITDMMEFAKPITPKMGTLDIASVIEEAAKIATEKAPIGAAAGGTGGGHAAHIRIEPVQGIPAARADAKQIRNAIAEIITNAIQASRGAEGDVRHKGADAEVFVQARFDPLDEQIIVQVTDHGVA